MDRGAWWATVHGFTKSWTQLKQLSSHRFALQEKIKNKKPLERKKRIQVKNTCLQNERMNIREGIKLNKVFHFLMFNCSNRQ